MKLNKKDQEFIAKNITKFDVVTGITVNDIEIRIHGATLNAEGKETSVQSTAVYRTNDIKAIYAHTHAKCVEAKKAVDAYKTAKLTPSWMQRDGDTLNISDKD